MPELMPVGIAVVAVTAIAALAIGWSLRGRRCTGEKLAINTGWQEQIEAQRAEHDRLVDQNRNLMEQVNQMQASGKDATNRARELSIALREALARRDELQRQIKEVRSNLESAVAQRRQLQADLRSLDGTGNLLGEKDAEIDKLRKELANWQERLPPLVERFREKNAEADRLRAELDAAYERLDALESAGNLEDTRAEEMAADAMDGLEASNDPADDDDDAPAVGLRDDLKQIKGIGPAIEKTLNELGIFRLHQVAEMTEYDIDRVARRLKGFRSRIYREDWIGQARELTERAAEA